MLAIFAAYPTGTAMFVRTSLIFPAVDASAYSSKGFILAKNSSTSAAVSVPTPKSIKFAPKEKSPSGI